MFNLILLPYNQYKHKKQMPKNYRLTGIMHKRRGIMKRIAIIITIFSVLFSSTLGVSAASDLKDIEVILSDTATVAKIGETIDLTATTTKHGSSYIDSWNNAVKSTTVFDSITETYISKAFFTAVKPGVYPISYTITMTAGDSNTTFSKTVERTIEVIDPRTVIGAELRDIEITPIYNEDGSVSVYSAYGTIYALWSDATSTPNGSLYFFFSPEETTKNLDLTLNIDNTLYTYNVNVTR
jgi:hypothetical protein